jgi:hypothetical protein
MYRAAIVTVALMLAPAAASAQQPCTTDARHVVDELYRHMLERTPDEASANWIRQLESGNMTVREVVARIAKSEEYLTRFFHEETGEQMPYYRSVGRFYRHLLGRQPDEDGARAFAQLAQRSGPEPVVDMILSSREYEQRLGDWGVPGSGGVRFCPQRGSAAAQNDAGFWWPANEERRFRAMDRNGDGVISRAEWRGSRQSFEVHDWNNDGVLSGDELRVGAARDGRTLDDIRFERDERFEYLDVNNNGRIEPHEWHGSAEAFHRLDVNSDLMLTRAEFAAPAESAIGTSGQLVIVSPNRQWVDTGIVVRQGDIVRFDVDGRVQLSADRSDVAGAAGALSGRLAPDAPMPGEPAGALIGRVGNSSPFGIGDQRSLRAPASGRLYLGINDDHLADNAGEFRVIVDARR